MAGSEQPQLPFSSPSSGSLWYLTPPKHGELLKVRKLVVTIPCGYGRWGLCHSGSSADIRSVLAIETGQVRLLSLTEPLQTAPG